VVRELVRISKDAIIKALARQRLSVQRDLVDAAVIELRNEYSHGLLTRHYQALDTTVREQPVDDAKTLMELYHARVLLEYESATGECWNAVNPVVQPLLERYRRGLQ
jgi:hypothetical protein